MNDNSRADLLVRTLRLWWRVWLSHPQHLLLTVMLVLASLGALVGGQSALAYSAYVGDAQRSLQAAGQQSIREERRAQIHQLQAQLQQQKGQYIALPDGQGGDMASRMAAIADGLPINTVAIAEAPLGRQEEAAGLQAVRMELLTDFATWLLWRQRLADRGIAALEEEVEPASSGSHLVIRGLYRSAGPAPAPLLSQDGDTAAASAPVLPVQQETRAQ